MPAGEQAVLKGHLEPFLLGGQKEACPKDLAPNSLQCRDPFDILNEPLLKRSPRQEAERKS